MEFGILGPLEVRRDGAPVPVNGRRVRILLALLLLDAGHVVPTARLVDGLWGGEPPAGTANALQSLVSRLRAALEPGPPVESHPGGYLLAVEPATVDAHRFERLVEEGRRAQEGGDPARCAALLRDALALWRGDPLADLAGTADTGAAASETARLAELRLAAIADRAEAELACGRAAELVPELEALVGANPLDERLHGLLMRALDASGRQAGALAAYERARRTLRDELGVDPSPQLRRLHLDLVRRDPRAELAPAARPSGLPAQLTSFVGREEDMDRVGELLGAGRLITLVGPGGAGKSRLAVEVAARLAGRFPDGVQLVELAPLADPADVPQAVLTALGVREDGAFERRLLDRRTTGAGDPTERLLRALTDRRLLLVLDNCEHLLDPAARLAGTILGRCPEVRVLATSREPLGLTGEVLWPVPPLRLPPDGVTAEAAPGYASVRLLCDRALAVRPDFSLDERSGAAAAEVCRRLDGMPLAIELAAARLRSLSVEQLAERLDSRFELLTGGSRTALPRHQTLRAVVDWSWDLLDGAERALFRRLSVFAGGVTPEAATEVCAGGGVPPEDVLDLLTGLVDRSLVQTAGVERGAMRYRLLETMRAYGAERLAEAGEAEAVHQAHAGWSLELAEAADPALRSREQVDWLARLDAEHDNLRAALRWVIDGGEAALALRLAVALWGYWQLRGYRLEARAWLEAALAVPGEVPVATRATALVMHTMLSEDTMDIQQLASRLEATRVLYEEAGERPPPRVAFVFPMLALVQGDLAGAREMAARMAADETSDEWAAANAQSMVGHIETIRTALPEAERAFELAAARFRALGERSGLADALMGLAEVAEARGDLDRAEQALRDAQTELERLGAREALALLQVRLGSIRAAVGDVEEAATRIDEGIRLGRELGALETVAAGHVTLAEMARRQGDLERAQRLYEHVLGDVPGHDRLPPFRAWALIGLGKVAQQQGDVERAGALHRQALQEVTHPRIPRTLEQWLMVAPVVALAGSVAAAGQAERSAVLLGAASALRGALKPSWLEQADLDRVTAAVTRALGEAAFDRAHGRGAAMTRDEILAYAGVTPGASRP